MVDTRDWTEEVSDSDFEKALVEKINSHDEELSAPTPDIVKGEEYVIKKRTIDTYSIMQKMLGRFSLKMFMVRKNHDILVKKRAVKDNKITFKGKMYNVFGDSIYFINNKPVSFYHEDNPNPLYFDSESDIPIVNSKAYYKAWNTKIVEDVLSYGQMTTGQKVTVGLLIGGAIAFLIAWSALKGNPASALMLVPIRRFPWTRN